LSTKVRPEGRVPDSVSEGAGEPDAVTLKLNPTPVVPLVEGELLMTGAELAGTTVRVKLWEAGLPTPLAAWMVIG
jgi:hypothetical protein